MPGAQRALSPRALLGIFAVVLLMPVLALGAALNHVYQTGTVERTLDDARASARLLAQTSVQPAIAGQDLDRGLDVGGLADLGASVDAAVRGGRVIGLRLLSTSNAAVFPPQDVGLYPKDDLLEAITADPYGEPPARLTTAALPAWLGGARVRAVQVYTPVFAPSDGRVLGTLQVLLPYESIAEQAQHQARVFGAVLLVGLAALYGVVAVLAGVVTRRLGLQLAATDHQAHHDSLTGLPNRSLFRKRVKSAMGDGQQDVVVGSIDLDRFKLVNDTLGHEAGDVLLRTVGQRLREAVRLDDTVARLGGDEFGIVLPGLSIQQAHPVLERVREALSTPCTVGDNLLPVSGSVGLAAAPLHGNGVEELLRHADVAMYVVKRSGRVGSSVHAPVGFDDSAGPNQLRLQAELDQALVCDQLVLHYQPVVDLADGSLDRMEALVRWEHPQLGLLGPDQFLPLAEATGQIDALTRWVLHRALSDLAARPQLQAMAVNVSPSSLRDESFFNRVMETLAATGVDPSQLTLEMTETALVDDVEAVRYTLTRLRALGVGVSMDDFGQGSTSLGFLGTLPFTEIKIDRAFVAGLDRGELEGTIVSAIVAIGHHAGMVVVAEGVESAAVLEEVRVLGCDFAQGYHLGRPAALSALEPAREASSPVVLS